MHLRRTLRFSAPGPQSLQLARRRCHVSEQAPGFSQRWARLLVPVVAAEGGGGHGGGIQPRLCWGHDEVDGERLRRLWA